MSQRLNHFELSAPIFEKMLAFSTSAKEDSSLDKSLLIMVDILVSHLNRCAFCVDMHIKEAKIEGERALRLYHIPIWRESPLFSDKEKAIFNWAEAATHLDKTGISDEVFEELSKHLSEKEISDLTFAIACINGWNRLAIPFKTVPGSIDHLFGLDRAELS
jgi:AhpD family alkylhydroperoxidase